MIKTPWFPFHHSKNRHVSPPRRSLSSWLLMLAAGLCGCLWQFHPVGAFHAMIPKSWMVSWKMPWKWIGWGTPITFHNYWLVVRQVAEYVCMFTVISKSRNRWHIYLHICTLFCVLTNLSTLCFLVQPCFRISSFLVTLYELEICGFQPLFVTFFRGWCRTDAPHQQWLIVIHTELIHSDETWLPMIE